MHRRTNSILWSTVGSCRTLFYYYKSKQRRSWETPILSIKHVVKLSLLLSSSSGDSLAKNGDKHFNFVGFIRLIETDSVRIHSSVSTWLRPLSKMFTSLHPSFHFLASPECFYSPWHSHRVLRYGRTCRAGTVPEIVTTSCGCVFHMGVSKAMPHNDCDVTNAFNLILQLEISLSSLCLFPLLPSLLTGTH